MDATSRNNIFTLISLMHQEGKKNEMENRSYQSTIDKNLPEEMKDDIMQDTSLLRKELQSKIETNVSIKEN